MNLDLSKKLYSVLPLNDRKLLEEIARVGQIMTLKEGTVMLDYGQYIKMTPIVLSGVIKVTQEGEDGSEILLYYLTGGNTCPTAFTCCMMDKTSEIKAVAEEPTEIIAVPIQYTDEWMRDYPEWKGFVMNSYSLRFKELLGAIDAIAFSKLDKRLALYLQKKVALTGNADLQIKHKQIADDLHSTREAISRLLKKMEKLGFVALYRNHVKVLDFDIESL